MENLPDEIIVHILESAQPRDLWTMHECSRKMRGIAEQAFIRVVLKEQRLYVNIGGGRRSTYPVARITLKFQDFRSNDHERAIFDIECMRLTDSRRTSSDSYEKSLELWRKTTSLEWGGEVTMFMPVGDQGGLFRPVAITQLSGDENTAIVIRWRRLYAYMFAREVLHRALLEVTDRDAGFIRPSEVKARTLLLGEGS